ncbi:MAG: putative Anti-sigma factor ChrR [Verrucomicrobiaceae bacterium]|nr:putative Anti-sigma factor ChrR [Verrucomicrobiaceae bacterium]
MNYHPGHDLLEQYAAGTLPMPVALCVSVHMGFCAQCSAEVNALQALSGMLLEELPGVPVADAALHHVFARIDRVDSNTQIADARITRADDVLPAATGAERSSTAAAKVPKALRKLVPGGFSKLNWLRVLPSLRIATLDAGCDDYSVMLHRVSPGGSVAMHDHRGLEFTLVLSGSFSDEKGVYTDGDFLLREPQQPHRPFAAQHEECLCLAVQQAPVRFTGFFWRLLNPFLR